MPDDLTPAQYFRHYRTLLGFSNQADAKEYLGAKDIVATIDYAYIDDLLKRLVGIIHTYDKVIVHAPKPTDLDTFLQTAVSGPYKTIKDEGLLPRLNNQGRRPEHVLFSWLRGYATAEYFLPALGALFQTAESRSSAITTSPVLKPSGGLQRQTTSCTTAAGVSGWKSRAAIKV